MDNSMLELMEGIAQLPEARAALQQAAVEEFKRDPFRFWQRYIMPIEKSRARHESAARAKGSSGSRRRVTWSELILEAVGRESRERSEPVDGPDEPWKDEARPAAAELEAPAGPAVDDLRALLAGAGDDAPRVDDQAGLFDSDSPPPPGRLTKSNSVDKSAGDHELEPEDGVVETGPATNPRAPEKPSALPSNTPAQLRPAFTTGENLGSLGSISVPGSGSGSLGSASDSEYDRLITTPAVGRLCGVSRRSALRACESGRLRAIPVYEDVEGKKVSFYAVRVEDALNWTPDQEAQARNGRG